MKKKTYSIHIGAPRPAVWKTLWGKNTYNAWTRMFSEGSHAETDWKEGSQVLFLDGKGNGMKSKIAVSRPNEFMSFEHLAALKDGKEEPGQKNEWAGARENYSLKEEPGGTLLSVDMDIEEDYLAYFDKTWPQALEKVRELSETEPGSR